MKNHGNLKKGFNFKNMLKLFCMDSGWIPVEGRSETIGEGELPCILSGIPGYFFRLICVGFNFKSGLPATINSKIQARVTDCNINFKVFFLTAVPATKWLKKTGWASQFVFLRD